MAGGTERGLLIAGESCLPRQEQKGRMGSNHRRRKSQDGPQGTEAVHPEAACRAL